ncbi:universal stress protein [Caldinitratiruptor microaerophilus]|uniref:Universal stress protein n=1 Tax=Caldinitratiruptor microaerophilus TaxID=671077 RepID=A0AA35G917_9FIRM|nr:universal stress protein [Caldinitratiruptor microaerophilus]BDG61641.1 universal stress protein [Caldinitratiruptor microaerophilus]
MRCILGTDGSPASLKAAQWIARYLNFNEASELFLVYVFPLPADASAYEGIFDVPASGNDPRVQKVAAPVLARTREALGATKARVHDVSLVGVPAESIVQFAAEMRADLVVVGSRGRSPHREILLGSVSGAVANRARCPVLVVR